MLHRQLDTILNKRMDRKEFLVHIGYGILLITGISSLLKGLGSYAYSPTHTVKQSARTTRSTHGFGASKFGV